jgi:two-component system CitB family sensor kinase
LGKLPGYDLVVSTSSESLYQILAGSGWKLWLAILATLALAALGMSIAGRQLREATLGMSPTQLASVIEEQQALLEGIYEGVIGLDSEGRIRFFNNEAQRLLNLPKHSTGRPLSVLVRGSRLKAVLTQQITGSDLPVVVGDSVLIINNIEVNQEGRSLGYVITIRDQTEQEGLLKELDSLVGMTETLRAQAHEFSNKLHTIIGLIEIGEAQEAVAFARDVSLTQDTISTRLADQVKDPMVTALIFAKGAAAAERSVKLVVDETTHLDAKLVNPAEVLSVLGNLIDNAIDAAALPALQVGWNSSDPGWVRVKLTNLGQDLLLEVEDSGTGIPAELREDVFVDGFSTKQSRHGARRGLGLALIKQVVSKSSGSIEVSNTPGAYFRIVIPFSVGPAKPKRAMATKKAAADMPREQNESADIKIDQDSSYGP